VIEVFQDTSARVRGTGPGRPGPCRRLLGGLGRPVGSLRWVTGQPYVVLTYDDGPDPVGTEPVLRALADRGATATFFVLTARARRYRTLLAETAAAGHEIALHGINHHRLTGLPPEEVYRRTVAGRAELEDLTGRAVHWFRSPYGAQTLPTWRAIRRAGVMPVVWSGCAHDWEDRPEGELAAFATTARAGDVLLAHDGFAGPQDGVDHGPPPAIDRGLLARLILSRFADMGLTCRSLATCLAQGRAGYWAWLKR
jgi:peptidoglycan/xylan/chitin deacetylase (PgdA/CDA1 family)